MFNKYLLRALNRLGILLGARSIAIIREIPYPDLVVREEFRKSDIEENLNRNYTSSKEKMGVLVLVPLKTKSETKSWG